MLADDGGDLFSRRGQLLRRLRYAAQLDVVAVLVLAARRADQGFAAGVEAEVEQRATGQLDQTRGPQVSGLALPLGPRASAAAWP